MCKKLPTGESKSDEPDKYTEEVIKNYEENSSYCALLKVDIDYPKELHKIHRDLPSLCDRKPLNKTMKLITSLADKKKICSTHICFKASIKLWIKI